MDYVKVHEDIQAKFKNQWKFKKLKVDAECIEVHIEGENINQGTTAFKIGLDTLNISKYEYPVMKKCILDKGIFHLILVPRKDGTQVY